MERGLTSHFDKKKPITKQDQIVQRNGIKTGSNSTERLVKNEPGETKINLRLTD